jgi:vacuolar-type H+-ATPase subunit I/STV1
MEMTPPLLSSESQRRELPALTAVFRVLAVLEMLGGIVLCNVFWPGEPEIGYKWRVTAYVPAITWLTAGLVSGFLFLALANILHYLNDISVAMRSFAIAGTSAKNEPSPVAIPHTEAVAQPE